MYLLFYKGKKSENSKATWFDQLICFLTRSSFSHIELAYSKEGDFYTTISSSTRDKGVRKNRIDITSGRWVVVELPPYYPIRDAWLNEQLGKQYDYVGLLGTLVRINIFSDSDKWFCSELLGTALGIDKAWSLTPEDIFKNFK